MPASRRSALAGLLATLAFAAAADARTFEAAYSAPGPALTPAQECAIRAALGSGDPRRVRIAHEVLNGDAGALALADPGILHHHGLDTTRWCRS